MPEIATIIHHEVGLHARPASEFVRTAAKYSSDIKVTHGETTANEGDDAEEALQALEHLVLDNFGEGK